MNVENLLSDRLVMVTGKGGTGKTTFAAALASIQAARGRRCLLCEVDTQRAALEPIFGFEPELTPRQVSPGLDVCNLVWPDVFGLYLKTMVRVDRIAKLILANPLVMRFIDFTPGSQELVILSVLYDLLDRYDVVVVDMPASGHAFSLLDITRSAASLFRTGPLRARVDQLVEMLRDPRSRMVFVALPEEMVVNETIETWQRLADGDLLGAKPMTFLNRATVPSLSRDERTLLGRLDATGLDHDAHAYLAAGKWEARMEDRTWSSLQRLSTSMRAAPLLVPAVAVGEGPRGVTAGVALALGRHVGLTRKDLPWT